MIVSKINFPQYTGIRCLMMPFIQGDSDSLPSQHAPYFDIIDSLWINKGDIGFLTIDESPVTAGSPHRGARAKFGRALHTEAGKRPGIEIYGWGGGWGSSQSVLVEKGVDILVANNLDDSCAIWDAVHEDTSFDGDIGDFSDQYPYSDAIFAKSGEVHQIGILTPHESLPVKKDFNRQFLRIVSSGVHGREPYFTNNPLMGI